MQTAVNSLVSRVVNHGIRHVIICPGSRNAPLTLSFTRNPHIRCYSLVDERSAAYTALGIAIALGSPVAIVCTSGTAVLNLYPAICEAYYSQIPLLIITADRPPELIDQWDGQCIRQTGIFDKHILDSFTYDPLSPDQHISRAIHLCSFPKKGPVHINVPLAEPLYEAKNEKFVYEKFVEIPPPLSFAPNHLEVEVKHKKILVLAGADFMGERMSMSLESILKKEKMVVLADVSSGLHSNQTTQFWDAALTFAGDEFKEQLRPDLLITIGKFTVSKSIKKFLKENKPGEHWHVTNNHTIADPFVTHPKEVECDEQVFLEWLSGNESDTGNSYHDLWVRVGQKAEKLMEDLFEGATFNEFSAVKNILVYLPRQSYLHLGNSMPIRFASFLAAKLEGIKVYANRGTSGIDGSTSTAAGTSMILDQNTFLLTGDLSFFYDVNGLWNKYIRPNFKIIVLNNAGGGIFRLIDGPNDLPEREDYFATGKTLANRRKCKVLAEEFGFDYYEANDFVTLQNGLKAFTSNKMKPGILEIFVEPDETVFFYKRFKGLQLA